MAAMTPPVARSIGDIFLVVQRHLWHFSTYIAAFTSPPYLISGTFGFDQILIEEHRFLFLLLLRKLTTGRNY